MNTVFEILSPLITLISYIIVGIYSIFDKILTPSVSWLLSIILLVILIRAAFFPLFKKQYGSMRKMQKLQPLVKEIQEKYSDDAQQKNLKMMELYKKHKVSPFTGCLTLLIQAPFFLAIYALFRSLEVQSSVNYYGPFNGNMDLVEKIRNLSIYHVSLISKLYYSNSGNNIFHIDGITIIVLLIICIVINFLYIKYTMANSYSSSNSLFKGLDDNQTIKKALPYIFAILSPLLFGLHATISFLIYWIINFACLFVQQWLFQKYSNSEEN